MRYSILLVLSLAMAIAGNNVAARQQPAAKEHDNKENHDTQGPRRQFVHPDLRSTGLCPANLLGEGRAQ